MLLAFLAGCGSNVYCFCGGTDVWTLFPFDGVRVWTYVASDPEVPYAIEASSDGVPEDIDGTSIYTVEYASDAAEPLFRLRWSSDPSGVRVHGFAVADEGFVDWDPPVRVATHRTMEGDVVTTETGGGTWTSTLLGLEPCPVAVDVDWSECGAFDIAAFGTDGFPLAGGWWAIAGGGVTAMEHDGIRWELSALDCTGDCDGRW